MGVLAYQAGRHEEAAELFAEAAGRNGGVASYPYHLGLAREAQGRLGEAAEAYRRAIAVQPSHAKAWNNLGNVLHAEGRAEEAAEAYRRTIAIQPGFAAAHNNLGLLLFGQAALEEAAVALRRAVALAPNEAETHNNLANALHALGDHPGAHAAYDRAAALSPDGDPASNRLLILNYRPDLSAAQILAEHRLWAERLKPPVPAPHPNDRDPERRLRIGYVSPDLRAHPVAAFLGPLLAAHDHAAVEVFAYADIPRPDAVTARLRGLADHWRETHALSNQALAEQVRADRIDILIDLAGHTAGPRLRLFALKPAPVQATWLGYPNTTGLEAMDWRIVDPVTDPPGVAEGWSVEALARLQDGFLCYGPPHDAPEVASPPSLSAGAVTFGSFNNPAKISEATVAAWAGVLGAVPGSRLLVKGRPFGDAGARRRMAERFAAQGIDSARLILRSHTAETGSHLAAYAGVDIALDPFPYNGTTTTCEALWMGVPVIALAGDRHAGRVGMSLLTRVGLADLIADSQERYVEIAADLAADPARLTVLRSDLRRRMENSPLCDAPAFAAAFEAAARMMWRRWCDRQASQPLDGAGAGRA